MDQPVGYPWETMALNCYAMRYPHLLVILTLPLKPPTMIRQGPPVVQIEFVFEKLDPEFPVYGNIACVKSKKETDKKGTRKGQTNRHGARTNSQSFRE